MKLVRTAIAFVWIVFLMVLSGVTAWNLADEPLSKKSEKADWRERLHGMLLEKCAFRDEMIHLYGGWVRVSGRSVCNGVLRASNGVLINVRMPLIDTKSQATKLRSLHNMLKERGKGFLYVQFPLKIDRTDIMLPRGFAKDNSHEVTDNLLERLKSFHVPYVDVRGMLDSTPDDVKRYFFKTDHHWNFDGAFKAYPKIVAALAEQAGVGFQDLTPYTALGQWERIKLPRTYMGSVGRRTGVLFGGTDEMFYYVPKFDTDISRIIESRKIYASGAFTNSVIYAHFAEKAQSMFKDNGYAIYGSDYDHVKYINHTAPVKKRLLVVKDSYASPIIAWLTTIFERVDVVDLRHFKTMSLVAAVEAFEVDVVAVMYNPGAIGTGKMWQFGQVPAVKSLGLQCPVRDVKIKPSAHQYNYAVFEDGLAANGMYKVSAKSVELTGEASDKVTMAILDKKTGKAIKRATMPSTLVEWKVEIPGDDHGYSILLYAGEMGKTAGVGAAWHDVELLRIK